MRVGRSWQLLLFSVLSTVALAASAAEPGHRHDKATVDELLGLTVRPFAIAHRGFGDNLGEDPSRPLENTVAAVREGFLAGASVVEVDVQITRDGEVAVFHDDFLSDDTCLDRLTLKQLQEREPQVPTLEEVLKEARKFNEPSGPLQGIVMIELKSAAPLCDPKDTQEHRIVSKVVEVIRRMHMTRQVMFTSFSPALLFIAAREEPQIARILSINALQFLTAQEIQAVLGLPVTLIDKRHDLGLQWAEVGNIFRLPGYRSVAEVLATAGSTSVRVIEADLFFLGSGGAAFVAELHTLGLKAFGFTATTPAQWFFLQSLGLDGVYVNDVPFGVAHEATIP